jgi:hypothetical protein
MRHVVFGALLLLTSCKEEAAPAGPGPDTAPPKDSPLAYKVLEDKTENNSVEYHALIDASVKHDDADKLLKFLYRYLSTRREDEPAAVGAYLYTAEAAYRTPPRSPIASAVRKSGDRGPVFENKVPLEFSQEVDGAVHPHHDGENDELYATRRKQEEAFKLKPAFTLDEPQKAVTLTMPYTEGGKDQWVDALSFNQALNVFTDAANSLFDNVAQLRRLTYVGTWKDKEVVRVTIDRADYEAVHLHDIDDRIGQHHGAAFFALGTGHSNDKAAAKEVAAKVSKEYRSMLGQLKGKAKVDPSLK